MGDKEDIARLRQRSDTIQAIKDYYDACLKAEYDFMGGEIDDLICDATGIKVLVTIDE
jgi:hypothetical protein